MDLFLTLLKAAPVVILLFGASIFLHEFGHYWVARKMGMKVEAFAIGFGPKMFGWEKDGIEYSVRWIPAGGFVKLPQMLTSEMLEGSDEGVEAPPPAPPHAKIAVALAGPAMNIIFAFAIGLLLMFTGVPKLVNPSIIGDVVPGSVEEQLGIRVGDRIVSINNRSTETWQHILLSTAIARTNVVPVIIERDGERKTYHLKVTGEETAVGLKMLQNLGSGDEPAVGKVFPGTPAERAKLLTGDKIIAFNNIRVVSRSHLIMLVGNSAGVESTILVEREGKQITAALSPEIIEKGQSARIGIQFAPGNHVYEVQKPGPMPWVRIYEVYDQTLSTLGALIHPKTGVGLGDMVGPIGILMMLSHWFLTDFRLALDFLILLNVNLAILNMMPIPVLDGGHTVMGLIEAFVGRFFGKKAVRKVLNIRLIEYSTMVFAVALISVMLYVSFNDIKRIGLFKSMFETESEIQETQDPPDPPPSPAK